MKCFSSFLLIAYCLCGSAYGQATYSEIMAPIDTFFEGFAVGDTTKMWSVTERDARLMITDFNDAGAPRIRPITMKQFMEFMAQPREQRILETYWNPRITIHDNLATVWLDYNLWVGDKIDHCEKDAFQLARYESGWKIIAIADTQRKEGCVPRGD
jgi:hypothetical protein